MATDFNATVEHFKRAVRQMLDERVAIQAAQPTAVPSLLWTYNLYHVQFHLHMTPETFQDILDMSPEKFQNIRSRCNAFNALPRQDLAYQGPYSQQEIHGVVKRIGYLEAVAGVPEDYWIGEPSEPGLSPWQLGVPYHGKLVNSSLVRYQECVSNLFHIGALQSVLAAPKRETIVEIGGGFGGLAHSLGLILQGKVTYILIDLPESLLFQAAYLALNNPDRSIYIYESDSFTTEFVQREREAYDFILVPNFVLHKLNALQDISLLVNMQSFSEMTKDQVEGYLKFAQSRVSGYLYSDNVDRTPNNVELDSLSSLLEKYFDLVPSRRFYDDRFQGPLNSPGRPYNLSYRKHFGVPKGSGRTIPSRYNVKIVGVPPGFPKEIRAIRIIRSLVPRRTWYLRKLPGLQMIKPLIPMWMRRLLNRMLYD